MNDATNIHQAGIQINFSSWERFNLELLGNDGVVLFQYLVFHCQNVPEWTHSDSDLRRELGIKRNRIESLRAKFVSMGILDTSVVKDRNDNDIRAYRILYAELTKQPVLRLIYRETDARGEPHDLATVAAVYKALAARQPKPGAAKLKADKTRSTPTAQLAERLKALFDERRKMHNDSIRKESGGKFRTASGTIEFSTNHIRKLGNAVRAIDNEEFIRHAFIAYCDILNAVSSGNARQAHKTLLAEVPRSPLNYFLSYSGGEFGENGTYNVIYSFGEYFAGHYGQEHEK